MLVDGTKNIQPKPPNSSRPNMHMFGVLELIEKCRGSRLDTKKKVHASKSMLLTAKALFPREVSFQFDIYKIAKSEGNPYEASRLLTALLYEFRSEHCVLEEVKEITKALRATDSNNEQKFLKEIFCFMIPDVQNELLVLAAKFSDSVVEHCRIVLLILNTFPNLTLPTFGVELINTLISTEKENVPDKNPVNCYRKFLVCDLLPLLVNVELPPNQTFRLLYKALEFYVCYLTTGTTEIKGLPESENTIGDPWRDLVLVYLLMTTKLGWELNTQFFGNWSKETVWQRIVSYINTNPGIMNANANCKPVIYAVLLLFLNCLHELYTKVYQADTILIEIPPEIANSRSNSVTEPPAKRAKISIEKDVTITAYNDKVPTTSFKYAYKCWDLFHSSDSFEREFLRATKSLRLENWVQRFLQDVYLYKREYIEYRQNLTFSEHSLKRNLHFCTAYFWLNDYSAMFGAMCRIVHEVSDMTFMTILPLGATVPKVTDGLQNGDFPVNTTSCRRHLHFLHLDKTCILTYITKLLIEALKKRALNAAGEMNNNLADGHMLVLSQLNWPRGKKLCDSIIDNIKLSRRFSYNLFMKYIVNTDLLEKFMSLSTEPGISVTLDIMMPSSSQLLSQRRMSTRGVDKGAKEDFKMTMRRQTSRWNEDINTLIMHFIITEKDTILQTLDFINNSHMSTVK